MLIRRQILLRLKKIGQNKIIMFYPWESFCTLSSVNGDYVLNDNGCYLSTYIYMLKFIYNSV